MYIVDDIAARLPNISLIGTKTYDKCIRKVFEKSKLEVITDAYWHNQKTERRRIMSKVLLHKDTTA